MPGTIVRVSGPLVVADGMGDAAMYDVARVSEQNLIGEIIGIRGGRASIQVYEDTRGVGPGEPASSTGAPLCVELGPGLIGGIFDGVQRPLSAMRARAGDRVARGVDLQALDRQKLWRFEPLAKPGERVRAGSVLGTVREGALEHRIMVPPGVEGEIASIESGAFSVEQAVCWLRTPSGEDRELSMAQKWPVRRARPCIERIAPDEPLATGQRAIDALFPVAHGGVAAVLGPFGSGKTVAQHVLAKWADADVVVYVGCGERGSEMTELLVELPKLRDPRTGESLMKRTVLIANTSDMPVAAREASMYTGVAIAEYFRDMGYKVALMADSLSRWAEALREISGRLGEMPGERGYPAYLGSRVAGFCERAGKVRCLGGDGRTGAITAIVSLSPPGGEASDPVSQAALRAANACWALSGDLAARRHFPAIDWIQSHSLHAERVGGWLADNAAPDWNEKRADAMRLLQAEVELEETARLVGADALSPGDGLALAVARMIREDFLRQDAFDAADVHSSPDKQFRMLSLILRYRELGFCAIAAGASLGEVLALPVRERIGGARHIGEADIGQFDAIEADLLGQMKRLTEGVERPC